MLKIISVAWRSLLAFALLVLLVTGLGAVGVVELALMMFAALTVGVAWRLRSRSPANTVRPRS